MLRFRLSRRLRPYRRALFFLIVFVLALDCYSLVASRPRTIRASSEPRDHAVAPNVTIYIASVHRNTEKILTTAWNDAVVALVDHLGPHNVHVTAIESGSQDNTKEALLDLRAMLDHRGASNTVSLGMTVYEQLEELDAHPDPHRERVPGWIWDQQENHYALRRIPYLAKVRNQAMEPLWAMARQGRTFDKVLWVNDVAFDVCNPRLLSPSKLGSG